MSIAADEKLIPVGDAFECVIGHRPVPQTVTRLIRNGKLKASKMLGAWWCTPSDVRDYATATTEAAIGPVRSDSSTSIGGPRSRSDRQKAKALADSNSYLDAIDI